MPLDQTMNKSWRVCTVSWQSTSAVCSRLRRRNLSLLATPEEGAEVQEVEAEVSTLKAPPSREEVRRMVAAKKPEWISKDFRPQANIRSASKKIEISTISETVSNRMVRRVLFFSGTPFLLSAILLLILALKGDEWGLSNQSISTFQTGLFVISFLGISYGIISASWTDEVEGSFLGWTEFKANLPVAIDRLAKMRLSGNR